MVEKKEKSDLRKQCELLCIPRTNIHYKSKLENSVNLHIMKLMDEQHLRTPFYGFPRMLDHVREACPLWILNPKRECRLYRKLGLNSLLPSPLIHQNPILHLHINFHIYLKTLRLKGLIS